MKTHVLIFFSFISVMMTAQTTFDLNWEIGVNGDDASFTIETGDTMRWNWVNAVPHTVTNKSGSTETFDSGILSDKGSQFSYTFTVEGTNDYQCDIHPATMFGTITVEKALSTEEKFKKNLSLYPNPVEDQLTITSLLPFDHFELYTLEGKKVATSTASGVFTQMNVSYLNKGIYLAIVKSGNIHATFKLVKK